MVVVRKPGKLRICLDPKDLNRAIKREHYHLQTIDEIIERLPKACVFSRDLSGRDISVIFQVSEQLPYY
jgi:hypothetical protein